MRILYKGTVHPTSLSKSLRKALADHGHDAGIRRCEELVAAMSGYANWHELRVVCDRRPEPSPRDGEAGPAVAAARRERQVSVLAARYGLATATAVVDALRPTGTRDAKAVQATAASPRTAGPAPLSEEELFARVAGYQRANLAIRRAEIVSRLAREAPGRPYDDRALSAILDRGVVENLVLAGALDASRARTVTRLPPGVDAKLAEYVRNPGPTDEEFQAGLDAESDRGRGLRDLERDLEAAEDAVSASEEAGDPDALSRASERHGRIGELVTAAEWAEEYGEDGD